MSFENPLWGAPHIHGELLKLGFDVAQSTVSKYMVPRRGRPSNLSIWLLVAGGALYSAGVIFHGWQSLRFQNAIWHGFVLVAACCHYSAILRCVA